ncbi:hypothetical protein IQ07DRAFT_657571 [Pyrenochaeta sp. DS3sAY3a]|nr:hypothetical protein IQ07DRAFT_657571 [Pyrenochaeta sp. DS3sAY3a]
MSTQKTIDRNYFDDYNKAVDLYSAGRVDECIDKAREILNDASIPRYHRMQTLILLGFTLGDREQAKNCRVNAEVLWYILQRRHRKGESEDADEFMADMERQLDELKEFLAEEEPEEEGDAFDEEIADAEDMMEDLHLDQDDEGDALDEEVADAEGMMEDMHLDQDDRMEVDESPT